MSSYFERLRLYFDRIGEVLRGEAEASAVFPNAGDIGTSREKVYADFLRLHTPQKCNVFWEGVFLTHTVLKLDKLM